MRRIYFFAAVSFLLLASSCEKKPVACLDWEPVLEADDFMVLESCSEDYEFLTWEFNDGIGNIGDRTERKFEFEGSYSVTLTAYSDGAYKSDEVSHDFDVSYRYLDYIEYIGEADFDILTFYVSHSDPDWTLYDVRGNYTEDDPLIVYIYDQGGRITIPASQGSIGCTGYELADPPYGNILRVGKSYHFETYKENGFEIENPDGDERLIVHWRYRF